MDVNNVMRKPKIYITEVRKPEKNGQKHFLIMAKNFPELMKVISCEI